MAKTKKNSLRFDADFTEDTVGFALESFLALMSFPRYRFSIEPFSRGRERWLGADARLNGELRGFKPFYMQFKRPSGYPDSSGAKVIKDRLSLSLPVAPRSLYFGLREKQKNHSDYQHNILYRLRKKLLARKVGDAAYVCPLFLDRSAYRFHVHLSGLRLWPRFWRHRPWDLEDILISSAAGKIDFAKVPVLREHVSIPPHEKVLSAKHSYSFTERGEDLCFHSPAALPDFSISLADFLTKVVGDVQSDEGLVLVNDAAKSLRAFFSGRDNDEEVPLLPEDWPHANDGMEAWLEWGHYLKTEFQIEQFAVMRWEQ